MTTIIIETDKGDCIVECAGWPIEDVEKYAWSLRQQGYVVRTEEQPTIPDAKYKQTIRLLKDW